MRPTLLTLLASLLWLASPAVAADSLEVLLSGIEKAAALAAPVRGEGTADIDGLRGKIQDHVTFLRRAGTTKGAPPQVFLELRDAKLRALAAAPGSLHVANKGSGAAAKPDAMLAPSDFSAEDLLPFARGRCATTRIADLANDQFTIVCEPSKAVSQYALAVYKFDRAKFVPLQVLLYKDSMTNLVRMLRQDDFVQVGTAWLPGRVVLQDFKLRTRDELTLTWKSAPDAPAAAFDPGSFASAPLPAPGS